MAEGYRLEDGYLFRIYVERASWSCIYKLPPGEIMAGEKALDIMINAHKGKERFFSLTGPQDDPKTNPNLDSDLSKPESIFIGSEVKKRILAIPVPKTLNSTNYNGQNTLITSIRYS